MQDAFIVLRLQCHSNRDPPTVEVVSNYLVLSENTRHQNNLKNTKGTSLISDTQLCFPPVALANSLNRVSPLCQRIEIAKRENEALSELRDTLLPKLISGELRIPDAEKFLEEAGI